ncbi:UPF0184 protein AAEL002161-like [Anopheles funestus]|uniref:Uncharacterized protein n=1 Tax=Anopheles funestus TaxID=62324 RepID=A0A182RHV0_ANOFN|nr:UPF0184 protein AAEL002161-like [Anopheles funestus]
MPPEPKETSPCQEKTDDEQQTESTDENETPTNGGEEIDLEEVTEEIVELSNRLDSLSTALDSIEQQNDDLQAQILLLLDSQRATLKSLKEENSRKAAKGAEASDGEEPMQQS